MFQLLDREGMIVKQAIVALSLELLGPRYRWNDYHYMVPAVQDRFIDVDARFEKLMHWKSRIGIIKLCNYRFFYHLCIPIVAPIYTSQHLIGT